MSAIKSWEAFLHHSLATRLEPEAFASYLDILNSRYPLRSGIISEIFLRPADYNTASLDPRISRYIQVLLGQKLVTVPTVLRALHKYSSYGEGSKGSRTPVNGDEGATGKDHAAEAGNGGMESRRWTNSYGSEESIFYRLAKHITVGQAPRGTQETVELIIISIKWMDTIIAAQRAAQDVLELAQSHAQEKNAQAIALATLLVAIFESPQVLEIIRKRKTPKGTVKELSRALEEFEPLFLQSSPQSVARLEHFRSQTLIDIEPKEKKEKEKEVTVSGEIDALIDEGLGIDSIIIPEIPIVNSRAGLYIYLNSLLVSRPLIDDNHIFAYLHNRYQGDIQATIIDLILASFDILANATFRTEKTQDTTILRSFLINKLPLLLATLSTSLFPPLTAEYCITEALNQVDTNVFPTLSNMFDESSSFKEFSDSVRQDFCFACSLHGLIAESHIETLLGDVPMQSLPTGGRYVKHDLVQQFLRDNEKAKDMVAQLENMDGNVGAVSQAITEVMGRMASGKDTMSLEQLCLRVLGKPGTLDVMLLFDKPVTILQPLCDLLDNWKYDEYQGEYQLVYQQFGAILLFVLAFTTRYNLSSADLGIRTPTSFIAKFLTQGHLSRGVEDLTTQEQGNLTGWIGGLFDNDSGAGLGDELMEGCLPQNFYLMIPTLFHQVVLACSTKNLSDEALNSGLEFLVDVFLLPALVPAITWLSSHLWEGRGDANTVLQILASLIINPPSGSEDAASMLNICIKLTSKTLEHSLRWLQRTEPTRQDVEPLSKALRPHLGWERRGASDHVELESWCATAGGGLGAAIKQTISNLLQWALGPGLNVHPANYTHRQILVGIKVLGAKRLLDIIVDEVKTQTDLGNSSAIIDIACALICAPDAASWDTGDNLITSTQPPQRRLTLREALKNEAESAPKLHKSGDEAAKQQAEILVRLYRKVEAQLLMPQQPSLLPQDALVTGLDEAIMAGDVGLGVTGDGLGDAASVGLSMDALGVGVSDDDIMSGLMNDSGSLFGDGMGDGMGF